MSCLEDFIREHREDDVRQLALQGGRYPDVDMAFALQQIAGWQMARKKIPSWATVDGIVYPPHLSMEQCSSEQTARYKALILSRCTTSWYEVRGARYENSIEGLDSNLVPRTSHHAPRNIVDLTGGLGVDFAFLAQAIAPVADSLRCGFEEATATYVERQPHLCEAARKNFELLGLAHAEVVCGDGVEYLHQLDRATLIYLDPARRDGHGGRTYAISDCTPDVLTLEEELLEKAEWVMLKLSPMLDWHKAVSDLNRLGDVVREVHIVSVGNECKELLLLLSKNHDDELSIHCVNDDSCFVFSRSENCNESRSEERGTGSENCNSTPTGKANTYLTPHSSLLAPQTQNYLYEPNASIMKAGCFGLLQKRLSVTPIGNNSHLFVSAHFIEDFPGRKFQISAVSSVNKNVTRQLLDSTDRANIAVRNFPMTADVLRKKLKLKDGGDTYIFGTTVDNRAFAEIWKVKSGPVLVIAKKT